MNSEESCDICGSPAKSKCSRCAIARYCGTECQKQDWAKHKKVCKSKKEANAGPSMPESTVAKVEGSCSNCNTPTNTKCANCHTVYYCKRLCQQRHWQQHKTSCHPYKVLQNETLGRFMVATRPIKAGELILKEEPLVLGPNNMRCLGCYKTIDQSYRCSKCGWPLCGPKCEESPDHKPECELSSPAKKAVALLGKEAYPAIIPLRCLSLRNDETKYKKFLELQDHNDERKKYKNKVAVQKVAFEVIKKTLDVKFKPKDKKDTLQSTVNHAIGIVEINGFEIVSGSVDMIGVFYLTAMMEHSCTPNTKTKFNNSNHIIIKAAVDIAEGDHITTTYTKILFGTMARRQELRDNKYFLCSCKRCADPTEYGTYFSALKCNKCQPGYLLPKDSLDMDSKWVCDKCDNGISASEAKSKTSDIRVEVEEAMTHPHQESLENVLADIVANKAHYNHHHMIKARHTLMQLYGRGPLAHKDEILKKKEKICQEFMSTFSAFDPGDARLAPYIGVALFEYEAIVMFRLQKLAHVDYPDQNKIDQCILFSKKLLQRCIQVLQDEPEDLPEGQLKIIAQKKLTEIGLLTMKVEKDEEKKKKGPTLVNKPC